MVLPVKRQQLKEFNAWIIKNYLPDVIKPVKKMKAIKMTLIDIKGNLKEQVINWKDNQCILVNMDN